MIPWSASSTLLSLGPIEIRWYGVVYALGFYLGYLVLKWAAERKEIENLTAKLAEEYIFLLVMASVLGGRLGYVLIYNPLYYMHNLLEVPAVWHGGMSIHGGLVGATALTWWFCKKHKISFYSIADALVLPLALTLVFGRITNYLNAELWGTPTNVWWCVEFPGTAECRHPSQLYEALYSYVIFLVLSALRTLRSRTEGMLFWSFIFLYGLFRFIVTFTRELDPTDPGFLALSLGQWLSLVMLMLGAYMLWGKPLKTSAAKKRVR